jgi:putative transposase
MKINKAFKYRIYPNKEQQAALAVQIGHARWVYNWGLAQSRDKYPGYNKLAKELPAMKRREDTFWLKGAHSQVLQQSLKDLDAAWQNFFAHRHGRPRFKSKRNRQSIRYPQPKLNWLGEKGIRLPKVGYVKAVFHRPFEGRLKSVTVEKAPSGKYFVVLLAEIEMNEAQFNGGEVGIDLGLSTFATTSSGEKVAPPKHYRKAQKKRKRLARQWSRKKKGSRNREKARIRLARLDEHIANQRQDFHHKVSRRLVEENQLIGLENLNVKGMMRNHHLAQSIGDAGWSQFVRFLQYKGEWYGCKVERVDRWYPSSKTCSACGHKVEALPLNIRSWVCSVCGTVHDRDVNASINIWRQTTAGAAGSNAWGHNVRPGQNTVRAVWMNQEANLL